jgi:ribosomal protein S18 acetylase RimI-like enzyme
MLRDSYDRMPYVPRLHTPEEDLAYVTRALYPGNEVSVAELDGRVAGFAVLTDDQLLQLHVAADAQNRAIGTALLLRAKERRPGGFTLWTFQRNEGARRFYERHGLRVVQSTDGAGNEEREPDVQYAWRPGPGVAG